MARLPIDDHLAPLYSLGQVADMLRVQQAFLRRLDEFEVVRPHRSAGGQRRYSRDDITRVQYVVELSDEGMTLIAIRRILELERQVEALTRELEATRRLLPPGGPRPPG
ncbi:MerR family transcriptional regulator [Sphaerisporangium sp. TRM90804]|uniref:MerR family transcriptional regulator n=1 Tax=Sphaerisporangium sp. TRM90804 TaxID=3031113 RepID=UPI00244C8D90|nr:MerR family transcriptional regulator [Sphaerisporangium sp. TRM90804]MDH2427361.1 MerR family transcriptional regulator [Sphaerisporangium sp. TRM90804]